MACHVMPTMGFNRAPLDRLAGIVRAARLLCAVQCIVCAARLSIVPRMSPVNVPTTGYCAVLGCLETPVQPYQTEHTSTGASSVVVVVVVGAASAMRGKEQAKDV